MEKVTLDWQTGHFRCGLLGGADVGCDSLKKKKNLFIYCLALSLSCSTPDIRI